jgi:HPt (histidine-containing phosphotransfer) domain-containing protein
MAEEADVRDDLRDYFAGRLPARLAEIEEAFAEVRAAGWAPEPLGKLHRLVHSLAGAGGTFGWPEVTDAARELESFLKGQLVGLTVTVEEADGRVAAAMAELRRPMPRTESSS